MRKIWLIIFLLFIPALVSGQTSIRLDGFTNDSSVDDADEFIFWNDGASAVRNIDFKNLKKLVNSFSSLHDIQTIANDGALSDHENTNQAMSLVTYNDKQYVGYWDESLYMTLCERDYENRENYNAWTCYKYDGNDDRASIQLGNRNYHYGIALGFDDTGVCHVSYAMHNEALNYRKCSSSESIAGLGDEISMLGANENSVTYPIFFNDNNKKLFFLFRNGSGAANSEQYLYKYNSTTPAWEAATGLDKTVGKEGRLWNGEGTSGAYFSFPYIDDDNKAHFAWNIRTVSGNEDVNYFAYDLTNGGLTDSDGNTINAPFTASNREEVVDVSVANFSGFQFNTMRTVYKDSNGKLHIVYSRKGADGESISTFYVNKTPDGLLSTPKQIDNFPQRFSSLLLLVNDDEEMFVIKSTKSGQNGMVASFSNDLGQTWKHKTLFNFPVYPGTRFNNVDYSLFDSTKEFNVLYTMVPTSSIQFSASSLPENTRSPIYLLRYDLNNPSASDPTIEGTVYSEDDINLISDAGDINFLFDDRKKMISLNENAYNLGLLADTFVYRLYGSAFPMVTFEDMGNGSATSGARIAVGNYNNFEAADAGDRLGCYMFYGQHTDNVGGAGTPSICGFAAEDWTGATLGSSLEIRTVPIGANSATSKIFVGSNYVGIGTTNPASLLDVAGTATMTGFKLSSSPTSGYVLTSDADGVGTWAASTASSDVITEGNTSAEVVDTGSDGHFKVLTEGTEALRVLANGNVGIGTSAPTRALHLIGNAYLNAKYHVLMNTSSTTDSPSLGFGYGTAGTYTPYIIRSKSGRLEFLTGAAFNYSDGTITSGGTPRVAFDSSGNVGIGTTAPAAKLDVLSVTEQQRLSYDASNYMSTTVGSAGGVTFNAVGTGAGFTFSDPVIVTSPAAQTIAAGNTVADNACGSIKKITAAGAVTTDTTNTFTAPAAANDSCCMDVINVGAENITLDNNTNFVSAGAADVVLGAGDTVRVCSTGASGKWYQIGTTGNN